MVGGCRERRGAGAGGGRLGLDGRGRVRGRERKREGGRGRRLKAGWRCEGGGRAVVSGAWSGRRRGTLTGLGGGGSKERWRGWRARERQSESSALGASSPVTVLIPLPLYAPAFGRCLLELPSLSPPLDHLPPTCPHGCPRRLEQCAPVQRACPSPARVACLLSPCVRPTRLNDHFDRSRPPRAIVFAVPGPWPSRAPSTSLI